MTKTTKATRMSKAAIAANLEKLRKDIAIAVESANTMRDRIQHALVGCVSHWAMTGSNAGLADIVNEFIEQLGQGVNLKAVSAWCQKHLHMQPTAEGDKLCFKPVKANVLSTKDATAEKWWTLKVQNDVHFDLTKAIIALANKAAKEADKQSQDDLAAGSIDPALMEGLAKLAKAAEETVKGFEPNF